jgi:hypothetical protein
VLAPLIAKGIFHEVCNGDRLGEEIGEKLTNLLSRKYVDEITLRMSQR